MGRVCTQSRTVAVQPATQFAVRQGQSREIRPEQDRRRELLRDGLLHLLACMRLSLRVELQAADRQHESALHHRQQSEVDGRHEHCGVTDAASVAVVLVVPGMVTNAR